MYTFILMLEDFIKNNHIHWFMLFFIFIFLRWTIVQLHTRKYKPYKHDHPEFFSSVIIPVVDEPLDLFKDVLDRISKQKPSEIIVVINGPRNPQLSNVCLQKNEEIENNQSDETKIKVFYTPIAGKRNAIKVGLSKTSPESEIAVLVDSDTIWTKGTLEELLKPFACDKNIGGVTTRQKILEPTRKLITMFADLLEEIRAEGTMKAMSVTGKVGCLPGRTIAFRTSILRDVIDEFMSETFMGIHKEVSDDRSLTNLTLLKGYKTVMQDTSLVYTDAPLEWKKFIRQQLRWSEGSQYNNIRMTPWMVKHAKLMAFIYWADMLMPMFLVSVYANMLICFIAKYLGHPIMSISYPTPLLMTILLIILGCIISFGSRNLKVLKNSPWYYTLMIPLFIGILTLIMVPVRIVGLMRCADGLGWGTRKLTADTPS